MNNTTTHLTPKLFLLLAFLTGTAAMFGASTLETYRDWATTAFDQTGGTPRVIGSIPANGDTNVPLNTTISANELDLPNGQNNTFGVDNGSVTNETVKLFNFNTNAEIEATVNGTGGGDAINLTPKVPLEVGTTYRFVVDGVLDLTGARFERYVAIFTTVSERTDGSNPLDGVSFTQVGNVATGATYTSVTIGPDNRLYGLQITGTIDRWDISLSDGSLRNMETISVIEDNYGARTAIGLTFSPSATADNLVAFVSHSTGVLTNGPAWDGKISRLSGPELGTEQLLVTNLPRSRRDHLINSISFREGEANVLYFNVGSNTAGGAPDGSWGFREERLMSAATLRLDLDRLPAAKWPLDAKTTMDQAAINAVDVNSPTLGSGNGTYVENGKTYPDDGTYNPFFVNAPLTIFATGIRNAYDLVWHSNGQLYIPTNGTAGGANTPASVNGTRRTNGEIYDYSDPSGKYPEVPATFKNNTQRDWLFRVDPTKLIGFFGHANPLRGEYVLNRGPADVVGYPESVVPDANYRGFAFDFGFNKSPDGAIEYRSVAEEGKLQGVILVCRYSGGSDIIALVPNGPDGDVLTVKENIPGFNNFERPLDLTEDLRNGNLYVSDVGRRAIVLLKPSANSEPEPNIQVNPISVITDDLADGIAGEEIAITITNRGNAALISPSVKITGPDADQFSANLTTLPNIIDKNGQATLLIKFNPTTAGPKRAVLEVSGRNAVVSAEVQLRGLGRKGSGGDQEPSLQQIFDVYDFEIEVGDQDPTTNVIDLPGNKTYNSLLGDELSIQFFQRAVDEPVSVQVLSVFGPEQNTPITGVGWYESGIASTSAELFTISNAKKGNGQTLNPELNGTTLFNPRDKVFGFYSRWPFFDNRYVYSEDGLNTFEGAIPHHVRVYEVPGVDNQYIIAFEEHIRGYDYQDVVLLVKNIEPASVSLSPRIAATPQEMIFEAGVQDPAPFKDIRTLTIRNTGNAPLVISDVQVGTGKWGRDFTFTGPSKVTIAPASAQEYTVTFQPARTLEDIGAHESTLTFKANTDEGSYVVNLSGLKKIGYEGTKEPPLQEVVKVLGYNINVGWDDLKGPTTAALQGQEVNEPLFEAANVGQVGMTVVARYSPSETLPYGYYTRAGSEIRYNRVGELAEGVPEAQMLFPPQKGDAVAVTSFTSPRGAFGVYAYANTVQQYIYTEDALNSGAIKHRTRIYPVRDRAGVVVPNSYLIGFEEADNGDYQDYVILLTNAKPFVAPPPALSFEPATLNINAVVGKVSARYTTDLIANNNIGDQAVTLKADQPWIKLPNSFTYGEQIDISVDASLLPFGVYEGTVTATADGFAPATLRVIATVNEADPSGTFKINFQDDSFSPPFGYLADTGLGYGRRSNGQTYGWIDPVTRRPKDNTIGARGAQRGVTNTSSDDDKLLRSLNHFDLFGQNDPHDWEIAVPNGLYQVELAAGDPSRTNSRHTIRVEGETVIRDFVPSATATFQVARDTVRVSDGRLTLDDVGAPANADSKVLYLNIVPVDSSTFAPDLLVQLKGNRNPAGEYFGEVVVSLEAVDRSGSGSVGDILYSLNGAEPVVYLRPFTIRIPDGQQASANEITATVTDGAGNVANVTRRFTLIAPSGATLRLENRSVIRGSNDGLPSDDFFSFSKIERPSNFQGTFTATRLENTMRLYNDGSQPLVINKLTTTDTSIFVVDSLDIPAGGLVVEPGKFVEADIRFVYDDGGPYRVLFTEQLVIGSNADNGADIGATLVGGWMQTPEGSGELTAQQIFEASGFKTQLGKDSKGDYILRPSSDRPTAEQVESGAEGDLILTDYFVQADLNEELRIWQMAAFHSRGSNTAYLEDPDGNIITSMRFGHGTSWFNSLLPWLDNTRDFVAGNRAITVTTPFSFTVNGYSSLGGNLQGQFADRINAIRFYKAIGRDGQVIPNQYIALFDNIGFGGCGPGDGNCDFQDNVYLLSNVRPLKQPSSRSIPRQTVDVLVPREFDVSTYFDKGYAGNRFAYSATLADGGDLPDWIVFDTETGVFSIGAPLALKNSEVSVTVNAVDYNELGVSETFTIRINDSNINCTVEANVDGGNKVIDCNTGTVRLNGRVSVGGASWTGPNGFTSTASNPEVSLPGIYTLRSTDPNCPVRSTVEVKQGLQPSNLVIQADFTNLSCSVETITLVAVSDDSESSVTWFNGNTRIVDSDTLRVTTAGTYKAIATSEGGCKEEKRITIGVDPTTSPSAGNDGSIEVCSEGGAFSLYQALAQQGGNPQEGGVWTFNGAVVPDRINPATARSGNYVYTVGGGQGCGTDAANLTVSFQTAIIYYADIDRDGFGDPRQSILSCVPPPGYVTDNSDNCPTVNSASLADADGDGIGDACDPDDDNDGVPDVDDCGPFNSRVGVSVFYYADFDGDGYGDPDNGFATCALPPANYVRDNTDNCPNISNPNQIDSDGDGVGDICDNSATGASVFWLEAECAEVGGKYVNMRTDSASAGTYVVMETFEYSRDSVPADTEENRVRFIVSGVQGGEYRLFGRGYHFDTTADSYWVRINGGEWFIWARMPRGVWSWSEVTDKPFILNDGITVIDIVYREGGAQLDKLYLSLEGRLPTGFGEEAINCSSAFNQPPIPLISLKPPYGSAPLDVTLDGSSSRDTDGFIETYEWNWNDGGTATGPTPSREFEEGTYDITLTVTDNEGASSEAVKTLRVLDGEEDTDGDGIPNNQDVCPLLPNPSQIVPTYYADFDNDGLGDPNVFIENCEAPAGYVLNANDNCPGLTSTDVTDTDGDGIGDACDDDDDGDGVPDAEDCKPLNALIGRFNTYYADFDEDGFGDPDSSIVDCTAPAGYVLNNTDNCPTVSNADQLDSDNDGIGNTCDASVVGQREFWLEAECAEVGNGWRTRQRDDASEGAYVVYPSGSATNTPPEDVAANRIRFTVNNVQPGIYRVYGRVSTATGSEDSFWVRVNDNEWIRWAIGRTDGIFEWKEVLDSPFDLPDGTNTIDFAFREDGAQLDKLYLATNDVAPSGLGAFATNCGNVPNDLPIAVAAANPTSGSGPLDVTLNGSGSSDPDGTIISYDWTWKGGNKAVGLQPKIRLEDGEYAITLTVTDEDGGQATDVVNVSVSFDPTDTDGDGVRDVEDNCPTIANPDQAQNTYYADFDGDGYGDPATTILACAPPEGYVDNQLDNCPDRPSQDLTDTDGDGIGDACDPDDDNDGVVDGQDCFPLDATRTAGATFYADFDGDGFGDANDTLAACNQPANYVLNKDDNCPTIPNPTQRDADNDGIGDACDPSIVGVNVFWLEAECAQVGGTWTTISDDAASGGSYVVSRTAEAKDAAPDDVPANRVRFAMDQVRAGRYFIYGRIRAANSGDDSFWIRVNGGRWIQWTRNILATNKFEWFEMVNSPFNLERGFNTVDIAFRENGAQLDKLYLNFESGSPSGFGASGINCGGDTDNRTPIAVATATPTFGAAPLTVQLDGTASTDQDGQIVSYEWTYLNKRATTATPTITLTEEGIVDVILRVTDDKGAVGTDRVRITVGEPDNQPPVAVATARPSSGIAPLQVDLIGTSSSDADGRIVSYVWTYNDKTLTGPIVAENFPKGEYSVVLTVTDDDGATGKDTVLIRSLETSSDTDGDGVQDEDDNCPTVANPDQTLPTFYADADGDGFGDPNDAIQDCIAPEGYVDNADDKCPTVASTDQTDTDGDGQGDVCDDDDDNDGVLDADDCAPLDATRTDGTVYFADVDGDGYGDPTDSIVACATIPAGYVANKLDNCPTVASEDLTDTDGDGIGNACDDDDDNDGVLDADDCAPLDATRTDGTVYYADVDGDGFGDLTDSIVACGTDIPAGYVDNETDNCPIIANPDQVDTDGDGQGDACDEDDDNDGVLDGDDCAPLDPTQTSSAVYFADVDGDGFGDATDSLIACTQPDGYVANKTDNCPTVANPDQVDTDGDGQGDACDEDDDNDGVLDADDCAPLDPTQTSSAVYFADVDGDGFGDATDSIVDCTQPEGYVANKTDNCPTVANPDQTDTDGDGIGDACDEADGNTSVFTLEAECATVGSNWTLVEDVTASRGQYVAANNASDRNAAPADLPENYVRFTVEDAKAGAYQLFARVYATNGGDDSFWVRVNDGSWVNWNRFTVYRQFVWNAVPRGPFNLTAGTNTIDFAYKEKGARLDKLHLGIDATLPTDFGELATNCAGTVDNQVPVAVVKADVTSGLAPLTVQLDGSGSFDNDGSIVSYAWSWADQTATTATTTATFETPGTYTVTLKVTDDKGAVGSSEVTITVTAPDNVLPTAVAKADPITGVAPLTVSIDGTESSDPDGEIVSYAWTWSTGTTDVATGEIVLETAGEYALVLTVTDNRGGTATDTVVVTVTEQGAQPPVAVAAATPLSGNALLDVQFDGSGSTDPDGQIVSYVWTWADGGSVTGVDATFVFSAGVYDVTLTVTDDFGNTATDVVRITATADASDTDGDGVPDVDDNCPTVANPDQQLTTWYADRDGDTFGDPLDSVKACTAPAGYVDNKRDNCPTVASSDLRDTDGDGIGDLCDDDDDNDGTVDSEDCRPLDPAYSFQRLYFADLDGDGFGDANNYVLACVQPAGYVLDFSDNCPTVSNPDQRDSNGDGVGDACETAPPATFTYWLEAECTTRAGAWRIGSNSSASEGKFVGFNGPSRLAQPTADLPSDYLTAKVDLEADGLYHLFFRMNAWRSTSNSFWVKVDDRPWMNFSKFIGGTEILTEGLEWVKVNDNGFDVTFDLTAGEHTLTVSNRESFTLLDMIGLSLNKTLPKGLGGVATNCTKSNFAGTDPQSTEEDLNTIVEEMQRNAAPMLDVFPNPTANDLTFLVRSDYVGRMDVTISDINGRLIRSYEYDKTETRLQDALDVSQLPMGTYTLRIVGDDRQLVKKFVKLP